MFFVHTHAVRPVIGFMCMCLLVLCAYTAQAAPIGRVIALTPQVDIIRAGQTTPLKLKDGVELQDEIRTNATGKAQIIFDDDSTVTCGNNSSFTMQNFAESGSNATFQGRLLQGTARIITGKVVEQNPKGFSVVTPEATIGIRGTILTVQRMEGRTTVMVENTMRGQVYVNNILVPQGLKITVGPNERAPVPQPITPEDKQTIAVQTTVAAAAPAQRTEGAEAAERTKLVESAMPQAPGAGAAPESDLAQAPLAMEAMGNVHAVAAPTNATASGTLNPGSVTGMSGSFSFNVNLSSGSITNAAMNGSNLSGDSFNLSGGYGSANSGGYFNISNCLPVAPSTINGNPVVGGGMSGDAITGTGALTNAGWHVRTLPGPMIGDYGTADGTVK